MASAHAAERLVAARSEVKRACDLLIAPSPAALDSCQGALERAVSELNGYRPMDGDVRGAGARQEAYGLRSEVLRAAHLLQSLARFYSGWERILGAMTAGYTAGGEPAPVARMGRLNCRG
jgi:hypothetical protein